jgi:hypothetical protein
MSLRRTDGVPYPSGNRVGARLSDFGGAMSEQRARWPEATFDIIWHQHNPDDWMADVRDLRTGQKRRVYTLEELTQFVQSHVQVELWQPPEA